MKTFATSISIRASAERIWSLLVDGAGYPSWNSTVDRVVGTIAPGEKVTVYTKAPPGRAFPLQVTEFEAGRRMVWWHAFAPFHRQTHVHFGAASVRHTYSL